MVAIVFLSLDVGEVVGPMNVSFSFCDCRLSAQLVAWHSESVHHTPQKPFLGLRVGQNMNSQGL